MSANLKHGFLFTLVAASLGLTLALVLESSRDSQAADHRDGPLIKLDLAAAETVKNLLGDDLKQTLMYTAKFPLATSDDAIAVDGKTDGAGLFGKSKGVNFKFPNKGRSALRIRAKPRKLKNFVQRVKRLNTPGQVGNEDAEKKVAKQRFPASVRNRPAKAKWSVGFFNNVPVESGSIRVRRKLTPRNDDVPVPPRLGPDGR